MNALVPAAMSLVPPRKPPVEIGLDFLPQFPVGVTLRDFFAAFAMAGLVANVEIDSYAPDSIAGRAYQHADAMLRRREYGTAH